MRVTMLKSRFGIGSLVRGNTYDLPEARARGLVAAGQATFESTEAPPPVEVADAPDAAAPQPRRAAKAPKRKGRKVPKGTAKGGS